MPESVTMVVDIVKLLLEVSVVVIALIWSKRRVEALEAALKEKDATIEAKEALVSGRDAVIYEKDAHIQLLLQRIEYEKGFRVTGAMAEFAALKQYHEFTTGRLQHQLRSVTQAMLFIKGQRQEIEHSGKIEALGLLMTLSGFHQILLAYKALADMLGNAFLYEALYPRYIESEVFKPVDAWRRLCDIRSQVDIVYEQHAVPLARSLHDKYVHDPSVDCDVVVLSNAVDNMIPRGEIDEVAEKLDSVMAPLFEHRSDESGGSVTST